MSGLALRQHRVEAGGVWGEGLIGYGLDSVCERMMEDAELRGWEELTPEEEAKILAAREDYDTFVEYCFRDTFGNPVKQQWFHRNLAALLRVSPYTAIKWANEHGKSKQQVFRWLWKLGKRHKTTAGSIIMDAAEKAFKTLGEVKKNIEHNVFYNRVFPHVRKGDTWRRNCINVEGHNDDRNYSLQALGLYGQINGDRQTDIEADDIITYKNALSLYQSRNIISWLEGECISRLLEPPPGHVHDPSDFPITATFTLSGTPWSDHDATAHFPKKKSFQVSVLPVIACELEEILNPIPGVTESKIAWPTAWPLERIQREVDLQGETEFLRTKLLKTRNPKEQRFKDPHVEAALKAGHGLRMLEEYTCAHGEKQATGLDLANADTSARNDCNVIFQLLWTGSIYRPLWIDTDAEERWGARQHIELTDSYVDRYPRTTFLVESNLGQKHFAQLGNELGRAKFEAVFTGKEKRHPTLGVEGIAVALEKQQLVLPSGYRGKDAVVVVFDTDDGGATEYSCHPSIAALVYEMRTFRPDDRHIPDILAGMWKAFVFLGGVQGRADTRGARMGRGPRGGRSSWRSGSGH